MTAMMLFGYWKDNWDARKLPWRADENLTRKSLVEGLLAQTTAACVADAYSTVFAGIEYAQDWLRLTTEEQFERVARLGLPRLKAGAVLGIAKTLAMSHDGHLSREQCDELTTHKYVGAYTAGMVTLLHGHEAAPVDTNVSRVGQRVHPEGNAEAWIAEVMADAVPSEIGYEVISAVLDVGADVCLPYGPDCYRCPLQRCCESAERLGKQLVMFGI